MALETPNFASAVRQAQSRADELGDDLKDLRRRVRERDPAVLDNPAEKQQRRRFLESLYGDQRDAEQAYERIIGGNELQDANYLARGDIVARTVVRITIRNSGGSLLGYGSGFLVGDGVLLTNNHVLPDLERARGSQIQISYDRGLDGTENEPRAFALEVDKLFYTTKDLDFAVVAVAPRDVTGRYELAEHGWLPLIAQQGKVVPGEWLTIIQHPKGERKQLAARENQLLKCEGDVLWYSSDTLGGSSGSPVFNNDWLVVALHHSGVPETREGRWQTIDGRDYRPGVDGEDRIKWIANEGIRVSKIVERLRTAPQTADHPLVRAVVTHDVSDIRYRVPVMTRGGATSAARGSGLNATAAGAAPATAKAEGDRTMSERRITVTLAIDDDGGVSLVGGQQESDWLAEAARKKRPPIYAPVIEEEDWRDGYNPRFLGGNAQVHLPKVVTEDPGKAPGSIARLKAVDPYTGRDVEEADRQLGVLQYNGMSIVMNGERKLAYFSAANVDGGVEFPGLSRGKDKWLFDDRIERSDQLDDSYYIRNAIDRGHLTRREDMEWGANPVEATRRANGTCTWTNCSPQHKFFNQDRNPDPTGRLWGGLEKYILEQIARHYQFRVQVFTGPIFSESDPRYRGQQIPLDFWKVVVAFDANDRLFATGYVLSQKNVLDVSRLDEAAPAVPFGQFETYQQKIATIEAATGLRFTASNDEAERPLSDFDPLETLEVELRKPVWQRRRARAGTRLNESALVSGTDRLVDAPLESYDDVILGLDFD